MKKLIIIPIILLMGCQTARYLQPRVLNIARPLNTENTIIEVWEGTMIGEIEVPEHGYYIGDSISRMYMEKQKKQGTWL